MLNKWLCNEMCWCNISTEVRYMLSYANIEVKKIHRERDGKFVFLGASTNSIHYRGVGSAVQPIQCYRIHSADL